MRASGSKTPLAVAATIAVAVAALPALLAARAGADVGTFTNPNPIVIPEPGIVPPPWKAATYPSTITVAGLAGSVTDVNVTLPDVDCPVDPRSGEAWPEDLDLLLVGPTGANLMIWSDLSGDNNDPIKPFSHARVTFDDAAPGLAPADTAMVSGTYKPTDDDNDAAYEDPAASPPGPDGTVGDLFLAPAPPPSSATTLAVFNGTDPNGTWGLWASDDNAGFERCELPKGWGVQITTTGRPAAAATTAVAPAPTTLAPPTSPPATASPPTTAPPDVATTTAPPVSSTGRRSVEEATAARRDDSGSGDGTPFLLAVGGAVVVLGAAFLGPWRRRGRGRRST